MFRLVIVLLVVLGITKPALAYAMVGNTRLDHALWPQHETRLVVAGLIVRADVKDAGNLAGGPHRYVTVEFQVDSIILGRKEHQGAKLVLPATAFFWPEDLVPLREKTFCIFVVDEWALNRKDIATPIMAIVPARKQVYARVESTIAARQVLGDEIVAQLKSEKSERRLRDMLLQLAPILKKEQASAVEQFAQSKNPWVKRAALACLIYATEDAKYLKQAAEDVERFIGETRNVKYIADIEETVTRYPPRSLFHSHYFFLDNLTWTKGYAWRDEERHKHLRILRGMLEFGIITDATRKRLETGDWPN